MFTPTSRTSKKNLDYQEKNAYIPPEALHLRTREGGENMLRKILLPLGRRFFLPTALLALSACTAAIFKPDHQYYYSTFAVEDETGREFELAILSVEPYHEILLLWTYDDSLMQGIHQAVIRVDHSFRNLTYYPFHPNLETASFYVKDGSGEEFLSVKSYVAFLFELLSKRSGRIERF